MTSNTTDDYVKDFERMPLAFIILMRLNASLMILLNGTVLFCLLVKKHSLSRIFTTQMAILCLTDTMAGITIALISFKDYELIRLDVIWCSSVIGFFLASQAGSLYNVMVICINRLVILVRVEQTHHILTVKRVILFSTLAIVFGFLFSSLPIAIFGVNRQNFGKSGCTIDELFGEFKTSTMKVFCGTFFIPLLFTNLIYGYSLVILRRRKQRRTKWGDSFSKHPALKPSVKLENDDKPRVDGSCGPSVVLDLTVQPTTSESSRINTKIWITSTGNVPHDKPVEYPTTSFTTPIASTNQTQQSTIQQDNSVTKQLEKQKTEYAATSFIENLPDKPSALTRQTKERQHHEDKAFELIGYVLLFLNIFTWPAIIMLVTEAIMETRLVSVNIKFPLFCTISINSVVNPLLYTVRVPEFRKLLKEVFLNRQSIQT